jgi:hypothetical protein
LPGAASCQIEDEDEDDDENDWRWALLAANCEPRTVNTEE